MVSSFLSTFLSVLNLCYFMCFGYFYNNAFTFRKHFPLCVEFVLLPVLKSTYIIDGFIFRKHFPLCAEFVLLPVLRVLI